MLKTRIITAVIMLLVFLTALFAASISVFALLLAAVVAASAWEWSRLSGVRDENLQTAYAAGIGLLALIFLYLPQTEPFIRWMMLLGFLFWLSVLAIFYLKPVHEPIVSPNVILLISGPFVFIVCVLGVQYLRSHDVAASPWLLLYALATVWCMDIGAYFTGRKFGRNKLAPSISPGKTWEGVFGGLGVAFVFFLLSLLIGNWPEGTTFKLFVATLLATAVSVIGDLYESRIKRAANRKDSSQLLPGHGGVLDRIDSVLAAVPVFIFLWVWL